MSLCTLNKPTQIVRKGRTFKSLATHLYITTVTRRAQNQVTYKMYQETIATQMRPINVLISKLFHKVTWIFSEVDFQPQESKVAVGVALSIECNVTGVTDLTSIRIFRGTDSSQTVCDVTQDTLSNRVTGIFCSGEVIPSGGRLMMNFTSVQCSDEDTYVCECNPEASTQKRASLSISSRWLITVAS